MHDLSEYAVAYNSAGLFSLQDQHARTEQPKNCQRIWERCVEELN